MKVFLKILPFFLFLKIFSLDIGKMDPTLLSYFSEDLGKEFSLIEVKSLQIDLENCKNDYKTLSYNFFLENKDKDLLPVILKGNVLKIYQYVSEPLIITDSILTGYVDFITLSNITDSNFLDYCEIAKPVFQSSDSAAYFTRISQMVRMGYDGEGVNICFIDDGFDPYFLNNGNISKFQILWNQKGNNSFLPPQGFWYGEEVDSTKITYYRMEDRTGHGTSLLSIISSEGYFVEGILKKSKIIGVNTYPNTKNLIEGIKYLVKKGEDFQKPFVVFMPLNYYWGGHKGDDLFEDCLKKLFPLEGLKRGISVPAGNLGNLKINATLNEIATDTFQEIFSNSSVLILTDTSYFLDIDMINGNDIFLRFFVVDNGEFNISKWISLKDSNVFFLYGQNYFIGFGFNPERKNSHLTFQHENRAYLGIQVFNKDLNDSVEMFITRGGAFIKPSYENFFEGNSSSTLCSPSSIENVISSGSYISRTNALIFSSQDTLFKICGWNSKNKNSLKPDIFSPGKYILSMKIGENGIPYKDSSGFFMGTSYSSIFTGIALVQLLQADSNLSVYQLYQLIKIGADIISGDALNGSTFSGYGFLNIFRSLKSQSVEKFEPQFSVEKGKDFIKIILKNSDYSIIECVKKNSSLKFEKFFNFFVDKNPFIGQNIYLIKIKDNSKKIQTVELSVDFEKGKNKERIFDIMGRTVLKIKNKGVYFKMDNGKIKKIIKF